MNLNVDTLAPLEDSLVAEITEHERGKCESNHGDPRSGTCTVEAFALQSCKCYPGDERLICRTHEEYVRLALAADGNCVCGRRVVDCWSVVVLP